MTARSANALVAVLALALSAVSVASGETPSSPAFTIDEAGLPSGASGTLLTGLRVRIELLAADARAALNGQSADLLMDDDCDGRRLRLRRVQVYKVPHQAGPSTEAGAPADWLPFSNHSYAAQIAEAICTRRAELMATAMAAPDAMKPAASPSAPAPASDPAPIPGPVPEPIPAPIPAPVAAPQPPTVPSTPPAASPPPPGGALVQYLSTPSEAELARARDKLRKHLGEDANQLTFSTAQAVVRGVTRYRGRIGPFPGSAEARMFCSTVRQRGFACLVLPHAGNR